MTSSLWARYFTPTTTFPDELIPRCVECDEPDCDHEAPKKARAGYFCGRCGQPQCCCGSKSVPQATPALVEPSSAIFLATRGADSEKQHAACQQQQQLQSEPLKMTAVEVSSPSNIATKAVSSTNPFHAPQLPGCENCHSGECECITKAAQRESEAVGKLSREVLMKNIQDTLRDLAAAEIYHTNLRKSCTDAILHCERLLLQENLLRKRLGTGVLTEEIMEAHHSATERWMFAARRLITEMVTAEYGDEAVDVQSVRAATACKKPTAKMTHKTETPADDDDSSGTSTK